MPLESLATPVDQLGEERIGHMLYIMQRYYANVTPDAFRNDLAKKDWAILLHENGCLCGFSTQVVLEREVQCRSVRVVFSGDTIIERSHWGSQALPIAFGRLMLSFLAQEGSRPLYWLLTTKGFRTYRFLPVFYREFFPTHTGETPEFEHALMDMLCRDLFRERYDAERGILRAEADDQHLLPGVGEINEKRRQDPNVAFFERANPGHANGDELVCIARFTEENIQPFILKRLTRS